MSVKRFWPDGTVEVSTPRGWRIAGRTERQVVSATESLPRARIRWNRVLLVILIGVIVWLTVIYFRKNSDRWDSTARWRDWTPV